MRNAIIASTALMASSALAQGTAHVVNQCSYEVYLCNTPASGGGFEQIDEVLSPGGSYSQQWTVLGNGMGWSIKLAKTDSYQTDLMQYEYTYHDDGTIWYDLSEVDGNPWDGNWMITATGSCNPKQQAYRYSTDDAYGMQSCPDSASITVTLCSGDSSSSREASSEAAPAPSSYVETSAAPSSYVETSAATSVAPASSSYVETSAATSVAPAPSSYEESSTTEAPVPTTTATGGWNGWKHHTRQGDVKAAEVSPSPTTMVTQKVSVSNAGGYDVTVTDVATEVVTAYVTAAPKKRHEHHPRHPHHVREE